MPVSTPEPKMGGGTRLLYYIGKKPARPVPKRVNHWKGRGQPEPGWVRPWLDAPVQEAVFLTPTPFDVAAYHAVYGHVYAYKVPQWVIQEAKGLHRFDRATEIVIPKPLWKHVKFVGKSMDKEDFRRQVLRGQNLRWEERTDRGYEVGYERRQQERRAADTISGPHLQALIKAIQDAERRDPETYYADPAVRRLTSLSRRLDSGLLDAFPVSDLWDDLAAYGAGPADIELLRMVKPPRAPRTRAPVSFWDAAHEFEKLIGKSVAYSGISGDAVELVASMKGWGKAVAGLQRHRRASKLWASQVSKVILRGSPRGSEEASWLSGGRISLVLRPRAFKVGIYRNNLVHELGHALEDKLGLIVTPWDDSPYGQPPYASHMAEVNASEDFAETFRMLDVEPRLLRSKAPGKFHDMRVRLGEARAANVVARWLEARAKKDYALALKKWRPIIEKAHRADDMEAAEAAFEQAAKVLRPLGALLEGVVIQRPEEQRKLKNVRQKLLLIQRYTTPGNLQRSGPAERSAYWAWLSWETLEDAVKSVLRVYARIEGYRNLPTSFRHGTFEIINEFGYRQDELAAGPLALLDNASDRIRKAGFGSVLYGKVNIVGDAAFCGSYSNTADMVSLNVDCQNRISELHTVVHELGHRHWYKVLSNAQRNAYEDAYAGTAEVFLTREDRNDMWQAFERAGYSLRGAERHLKKPALREHFARYVNEQRARGSIVPRGRYTPERVRITFTRATTRIFTFGDSAPRSVTDYGRSDVKEDYAEVFAFHVLDRRISEDAKTRFGMANPLTRMAANVVRRYLAYRKGLA